MIIEDYWSGIARRLQIESGVLHGLIPHAVTKGTENELALARILEKLVPPSVGVGSGIIFDSKGNASAQTDVILYDRGAQPQLLAQTNQVMFPVETVKMAIEVKTSLTSNDILQDFPRKRDKLQNLVVLPGFTRPQFALFAYSFADSDYRRASELAEADRSRRPEVACVITPGFVIDGDLAGFVPLAGDGDDKFATPKDSDTGSTTLVNGTYYPIYMLGKYTGQKYIGDPGRALLLYCMSLLRRLDDGGVYGWISEYTNPAINELQNL